MLLARAGGPAVKEDLASPSHQLCTFSFPPGGGSSLVRAAPNHPVMSESFNQTDPSPSLALAFALLGQEFAQ